MTHVQMYNSKPSYVKTNAHQNFANLKIKLAMSQENLSLGFQTCADTNMSVGSQKKARSFGFKKRDGKVHEAKNNGADHLCNY